MGKIFCECLALKKVDFLNFNARIIISMNNMFSDAALYKKINLNFNPEKVTNMRCIFCEYSSLKKN